MNRISRTLLLLAAMIAGWIGFSAPAAAQLELCNRTSFILYTAFAQQQSDGVTTSGWTRIVPGDCKTAIDSALGKTPYFVYARTSSAYSGAQRAWAGDTNFCVKENNFQLRTPAGATTCTGDDVFQLPFARIDTKGLSVWTSTFTESTELGTVDAARTAGLKRLLRDNGARKITRIDGKPDKQTGDAMSGFRKRMKLAPKAGTRDMFDALETEALKTATPSGYSICNDTEGDIWAVIAQHSARDWATRGWWKVAAGTCAKAITQPLNDDKIYLHAEKHGNPKLVSGRDTFCLTNVQFELEGRANCVKRGLTEAGFAMTATKGIAGYAAHIGNQGLVAPMKTAAKPK